MGNPLSVRRVRVETIDPSGNVDGVNYGVMAADSYAQVYDDTFGSLEQLNNAIEEEGCILKIVDPDGCAFDNADYTKIGTENFYGKDWQVGASSDVD